MKTVVGIDGDPDTSPRTTFAVLGVGVDAIQIPEAVARMEGWIRQRVAGQFIAVTGMHGVTEALHDKSFKAILNSANLVVPDGMPLVWLGRQAGYPLKRRVYGPELLETFCREVGSRYRHFFYGGAPGVAEQLATILRRRHDIRIAGTYSPPFRPLSRLEEKQVIRLINDSEADVLWVGLSTPKQERWMYRYRGRLNVPVLAGVGAAFDLVTGRVRQAPAWMQESGLEWLFRLSQEPHRLWRRYMIYGSEFVWNVTLELARVKKFD
jgi:N-acetylglucosaminyldiphosphoundecaprenol N-acetyl-beta-D-mannosaminyltransferase